MALRFPDILVIHVGLHTCVHALTNGHNKSMIALHEAQLRIMMESINTAIHRPFTTPDGNPIDPKQSMTMVVIQLPGRPAYDNPKTLHCSRRFNRLAAKEAHRIGFVVLEREEIERR